MKRVCEHWTGESNSLTSLTARKPHSLLNEIFTTAGIGTMVVPEDGIEMRSSYEVA
jgi:acetylglutamate kinase